MRHQFRDSGAKAIVILANCAAHLQEIIHDTDIETVVVTQVGDLLGFPKRYLVNAIVKYVKKMVPSYHLPSAYSFLEALDIGAEKSFQPVRSDRMIWPSCNIPEVRLAFRRVRCSRIEMSSPTFFK